MTIRDLCERLKAQGLSVIDVSKLLGVSDLQVRLYLRGETKAPGVKVALSAMRHITLNGEPVILNPFRGNQDVLDKVKMYEDQCAQVVRDEGFGTYELCT